MNQHTAIQNKWTPEKAQKLLRDHGMEVTLDQAMGILQFLFKLAESTQGHEDSIPLRPGQHRRAS